ncbi:hypothetical protein [Sporosarcina sp. P3]|uniref:hypothetical protein n=1 Tax=Sporosarcina sp. P3 TaxID=2048245 RepID=UPI0035148F72
MSNSKKSIDQIHKQGRQLVLTLNARGVENALKTEINSVAVFVGVRNTLNQHTINRSTAESVEMLRPIVNHLKLEHHFVRACISTAFHCPYEGFISPEQTLPLCEKFVEIGVDELSVADTEGMANPIANFTLF